METVLTDLRQPSIGRGFFSSIVSPRMEMTQIKTPNEKHGMMNSSRRRGSSQTVLTTTCKHHTNGVTCTHTFTTAALQRPTSIPQGTHPTTITHTEASNG